MSLPWTWRDYLDSIIEIALLPILWVVRLFFRWKKV